MNKLLPNQNKSLLRAYFWVETSRFTEITDLIGQLRDRENYQVQVYEVQPSEYNIMPPTKIPTNEVTWVFQEIVNTYGVARYREINPGLFTVTSFPFLFGMMFGDMGHGTLMLIFTIWMFSLKPEKV